MTEYNTLSISELTVLLKHSDISAYSELIDIIRPGLLCHGFGLLGGWEEAEKTVENTFHHLWAYREKLSGDVNLIDHLKEVFLYKSIDYLFDNDLIEQFLFHMGEVSRTAKSPIFLLP